MYYSITGSRKPEIRVEISRAKTVTLFDYVYKSNNTVIQLARHKIKLVPRLVNGFCLIKATDYTVWVKTLRTNVNGLWW